MSPTNIRAAARYPVGSSPTAWVARLRTGHSPQRQGLSLAPIHDSMAAQAPTLRHTVSTLAACRLTKLLLNRTDFWLTGSVTLASVPPHRSRNFLSRQAAPRSRQLFLPSAPRPRARPPRSLVSQTRAQLLLQTGLTSPLDALQ